LDLSELQGELDHFSFSGHRPIAYWMPESIHLHAICQAFEEQQVKAIWDIGASNGFLSQQINQYWQAHLKQTDCLSFSLIDPVDRYSTPIGFKRISLTVEQYLQSLLLHQPDILNTIKVDAMIISWPPPLNGFQEIIDLLQPKVVVFAYDLEGFCGRQKGSYYAEWIDGLPYFFELTRFDFMTHYPKIDRYPVSCYRDLKRQSQQKTGILEIHQRFKHKIGR
jgi:hypothetical protein